MPEFQREAVNGQLFICAQVYSPDESRRLIVQALIDTGPPNRPCHPNSRRSWDCNPKEWDWSRASAPSRRATTHA